MAEPNYIIVVQCHIVMERCSGYFCEKAFHERIGHFATLPAAAAIRTLHMTCGGCCGLAVHRKLSDLLRMIRKKEGVGKDRIRVHLASCITKDSYHGPRCPHVDYLKALITDKLALEVVEGTYISETSEKLRQQGVYRA